MVPSSTRAYLGRRAAVAALLALAFLLGRPAAAGGTRDAEAFVGALGERALAALREDADGEQRARSVAGLLEQAVDLDLVGRLVLGRHWQAASEAQRQDYVRLFRDYFRDGLARRLGAYSGGARLTLTGSREAGDGDTLVGTRIAIAGSPAPVALEWRVRREGERLVVIDVVAEGVSMLVTNRAQFDAVVARSGLDGLLAQMRRWHAGAASRPGDA
jgi:phospholipid transport system substrate-binding protein